MVKTSVTTTRSVSTHRLATSVSVRRALKEMGLAVQVWGLPYIQPSLYQSNTLKPCKTFKQSLSGKSIKKSTETFVSISTDVDECDLNIDTCDEFEDCVNTDGGYDCTCAEGFDWSENEQKCTGEMSASTFTQFL